MKKLDLKKELTHLYLPTAKAPVLIDVPPMNFLMMDGEIKAGTTVEESPDYLRAMSVLYGMAYTLKFMSKLRTKNPIDFTVMALEGQWWTDSGTFDAARSEDWHFTSMIMQPEHITESMVEAASEQLAQKKPEVDQSGMRFERWQEGLSVQIMHIGPYADEAPTLERMEKYMEEEGYKFRGPHHEIYIGDPRRSKPENLKTVLRHPVDPI